MSNFTFLEGEWPEVHDAASRAENAVRQDPRAACFYARRALELAVAWAYKHDPSLRLPYQDNLGALLHEPTFKAAAGEAVFNKCRVVTRLGNQAVHSSGPVADSDALMAVRELFHIGYWLARTYTRGARPPADLTFDAATIPHVVAVPTHTVDQLRSLEEQLHQRDERLSILLADRDALDEELMRLRADVAEAKRAAENLPDDHDYSEAQTRDYFIDLLLKEAGWALEEERDREFPVIGMPNESGEGFVDYVLWGDDGIPLALVEAKRTRRDPRVGQQQAKLYADCLEARYGKRPVIFYSSGYEHWLWDDTRYPPRRVQGFYRKAELELMIQRRNDRGPLGEAEINSAIVERYYQTRAIRRVAEAFEKDNERKALLVMATGAGKTRTVIALSDLLIRCNWVKRVLFLSDRVALVNQAARAFKAHLPDSAPVNLVTERYTDGRVFVSTYPTMMRLIDEAQDGQRRFGVGHFDLVVIDEAHRSVFQKYRAIFEYFDSMLVGLTATPKDDVDRNTYNLFDLEDGVPTDAYDLEQAVNDRFLVPPRPVSVPLKFQREGIRYDDLSDEDKDQWDTLEWDEDGDVPDRVEAAALNRWLFNQDTVDKVLQHLMTRGQRVAGGDRLGKTIIFAANQAHADFLEERFNANYPQYRGEFARVITFKTEYAQSLIDDFSVKDKAPHIAISVDMLDTGIDVPEIVNLVFFKAVRSKTKFWQMVGRGTRLCPDLFGPGEDKEFFYLFDYCQNLEYFSQDPPAGEGYTAESLSTRLFKARLELLRDLDALVDSSGSQVREPDDVPYDDPRTVAELRTAIVNLLHTEVAAMNLDNFVVRTKRRLVEKYAQRDTWLDLSGDAFSELAHEVAGLPSSTELEPEDAKRFDLLMLNLQLAFLRSEPGFESLRDRVRDIASGLEEKATIPMVREQLALIAELQSDEWWQDVTVTMLEFVRRRLRSLVQFIERRERKQLYTDFEDELGTEADFVLGAFVSTSDFARFRSKVRAFLLQHEDHITIHKLRMNQPLTDTDLAELERILAQSGAANAKELQQAVEQAEGLGIFVRSLVGLDRATAKDALGRFSEGRTLTASQLEFVALVIDHLTAHGVVHPSAFYEPPFTEISPVGPEGLFTPDEVDALFAILEEVRATALVG